MAGALMRLHVYSSLRYYERILWDDRMFCRRVAAWEYHYGCSVLHAVSGQSLSLQVET